MHADSSHVMSGSAHLPVSPPRSDSSTYSLVSEAPPTVPGAALDLYCRVAFRLRLIMIVSSSITLYFFTGALSAQIALIYTFFRGYYRQGARTSGGKSGSEENRALISPDVLSCQDKVTCLFYFGFQIMIFVMRSPFARNNVKK